MKVSSDNEGMILEGLAFTKFFDNDYDRVILEAQ